MSTRISGTPRIMGTPTRAISHGDRVRFYQNGRICGHSECETILSVYNPLKYCAVHAHLATERRRPTPRPVTEVACERCGLVFETANPARKFCSDRCRMAAFAQRKRAAVRAENRPEEQTLQAMTRAADGRDAVVDAA